MLRASLFGYNAPMAIPVPAPAPSGLNGTSGIVFLLAPPLTGSCPITLVQGFPILHGGDLTCPEGCGHIAAHKGKTPWRIGAFPTLQKAGGVTIYATDGD